MQQVVSLHDGVHLVRAQIGHRLGHHLPAQALIAQPRMLSREVTHGLHLPRRRPHALAAGHDHPIVQPLDLGPRLPGIVRGGRQPQLLKDRVNGLIRAALGDFDRGQEASFLLAPVAPMGFYSQRPFLSVRFSALSSATTARR